MDRIFRIYRLRRLRLVGKSDRRFTQRISMTKHEIFIQWLKIILAVSIGGYIIYLLQTIVWILKTATK